LKGVKAVLVVVDDEELGEEVVMLRFSGERKTLAHADGDTGS
jgi:hypothetical protein